MINNKIQKGLGSLKKIKMSTNEESILHENLIIYMDKTLEMENNNTSKVHENIPVYSPYFNFSSFKSRFAFATFSFLGFFVIVSGAVGASRSSLPGDILYPLKIEVVEPIQGLLMLTPVNKVNFEASKINTRLNEVETLAKNKNLTKENTKVLEKNLSKNFEDHAKAFDDFVKDTEVKNIVGTTTAQIEFENNIDQHSIIFDKIKENIPEAQKEEVKKLEDVVNTKMNEFKKDRKDYEEKSSQKENGGDERKVEEKNQN